MLSLMEHDAIRTRPQKVNLKVILGLQLGEQRWEKGRQVTEYWSSPSMGLEVEGNGKEGVDQGNQIDY